jgi:hypothetical protein
MALAPQKCRLRTKFSIGTCVMARVLRYAGAGVAEAEAW